MITNEQILLDTITNDYDNDVFLSNILTQNSHWYNHENDNNVETLNRILHDDIQMNSKFDPTIDIHQQLFNTITYIIPDICRWLDNPIHKKQAFTYTAHSTSGVGYRYDNHHKTINEYTTNTTTVVLQYDSNSKYGFRAITLYPSISPDIPDCTPTGHNLTGLIQKTDTYRNASTMKRAYLLYQAIPNKNKPDVNFYTGRHGNDEALMLNIQNKPNVKTIIRIKENDLSMWTQHDDKTRIKTTMTQKQQELTGRDSVYVNLNNPDMKAYFDEHMSRASKQIEQLQKLIKRAKPQSQYKQPPNVSFLPADKQHDDEYEP